LTINYVDIVCGLSWGDEAKGKITSQLSLSGDYDYVCRWAGGNNAGHTVYIKGEKFKTHLVPSGVFYGIKSVIGPGCVVNLKAFLSEVQYLNAAGFDTSLIKISPKAHLVTEEHVRDDRKETYVKLGTTARGIGPCYTSKASRKGFRVSSVEELKEYMWDEELYGNILCEGAQGFWLDLDYGNYPYVTSSTTLPYASCSLGFPPQKIRKIYGAAKVYDTRSGIDPEFPESLLDDKELAQIGELGEEYGVTTGRRRKVNWLNMNKLVKSINISGTTNVIISKVDILERADTYKLTYRGELINFKSIDDMKLNISKILENDCSLLKSIKYSSSPQII
jgi:adenylosuccinate synthase